MKTTFGQRCWIIPDEGPREARSESAPRYFAIKYECSFNSTVESYENAVRIIVYAFINATPDGLKSVAAGKAEVRKGLIILRISCLFCSHFQVRPLVFRLRGDDGLLNGANVARNSSREYLFCQLDSALTAV